MFHAAMERYNASHNTKLAVRVGIHTGTVVAGVMGTKKRVFDIWGDAGVFQDALMN